MNIENEFDFALTPAKLVEMVTAIARREKIKYSEAILDVCNEYDIYPEDIVKIIPAPLKEKLKNEAMDYKLLKDTRGNKLSGI
jgi:hypothetical protein